MSENNQEKSGMTMPMAVVIAGVLIAGSVLYGSHDNYDDHDSHDDDVKVVEVSTGPSIEELTKKVEELTKKIEAQPTAAKPAEPAGPTKEQLSEVLALTDDDRIRGNKDAAITIVEYSDMECPFCKRFHDSMKEAMTRYDGQVNWVFRHFPLSFHGPNAVAAAQGTECAYELGGEEKYVAFLDGWFDQSGMNGKALGDKTIYDFAVEVGLDKIAFTECLDSDKYKAVIESTMKAASTIGVRGTPASFIIHTKSGEVKQLSGARPLDDTTANGQKIPGFSRDIDAFLAK